MKKTILLVLVFFSCFACTSRREKPHPDATDVPAITIMSYNVHVGKGMDNIVSLERIRDDIQKAGADLIGIQEMDRFTKRNPVDQPAALAKISGFHFTFSKNIDYQEGEYGIAILSRHPILEKRALHYKQRDERESRGALAVKVHPDSPSFSKPIWFVTTHLGTDASGEEQKNQVRELLDWMKEFEEQGCLIVTGDMNQTPITPAIELFTTDFVDLWLEAGRDEGYTFNAIEPSKRIDYIFIRKKDLHSCAKAFVPESVASDHRPVVAEVLLK